MKQHRLRFKILFRLLSLIIPLFLPPSGVVWAQQNSLSLEDACQMAWQNHALSRNHEVLNKRFEMAAKAVRSANLPQLGLNIQVSWQSEVTRVDIPVPGFSVPIPDKDQYKAGLEATQVIYDGRSAAYLLEAEKAAHETRGLETEAELLKLSRQVDALFFNILMLRQQARLIEVQTATLQSRLKQCESSFRQGLVTSAQCDVLEASRLSLVQALEETRHGIRAGIEALEIYCGIGLDESTEFLLPVLRIPDSTVQVSRPDLMWFGAAARQLDIKQSLIRAKALPRVTGFAQAGYGRPGLNMLDPDFSTYFLAGLRLNMPLWTWNKTVTEAAITAQDRLTVELQRDAFSQGISIRLSNLLNEVRKFTALEETDREIIGLRSRIATQAGVQFEEGVLSANDLVQFLNEETQARLALEQHKLRAAFAAVQWAREAGKIK